MSKKKTVAQKMLAEVKPQIEDQYFVLECENLRGFKGMEPHGPFKSESEAMEFIREDGERSFIGDSEPALKPGRIENWGSNYIVVRKVSTWKPVPVVNMDWRIELSRTEQERDE